MGAPTSNGDGPAALEPRSSALLTAISAFWFKLLSIGVSVLDEDGWHAVFVTSNIIHFELEHGHENERGEHNQRCVERARRERRTVLAEHAGFHDLYVPVLGRTGVRALLVTGPFAIARATPGDLLARWHWLTGRHGHPSDPEFLHYVESTLATPVLEGEDLDRYSQAFELLARLMGVCGDPEAVAAEARQRLVLLESLTHVRRMSEAAASMVDRRTARQWTTGHWGLELASLGVHRVPEHALVGLLLGRSESETDAVGELLTRDAFQRACVDLAKRTKDVVCGRLGGHGVLFLVGASGSAARRKERLAELAEQARVLAGRRFGLRLHLGASPTSTPLPLSSHFEAALEAAEAALSQGRPVVHADIRARRVGLSVRDLRQELGRVVAERPAALAPRFERYLEAIAIRCGYVLEPMRAHLEAGFERMAEAAMAVGALDAKSLDEMSGTVERAARDASTPSELFAAYRRIVLDMAEAVQRPAGASRDRTLRRAVRFIHERFTDEDLTLATAARVAGLAPNYFSARFREREGTTFARYVRHLRIERAKQLLTTTRLHMDRIALLSGFSERHYFHRAFKQVVGLTPLAYRAGAPDVSPT